MANSILYHSRMQYLKSRDNNSTNRKQKRKSSLDLFHSTQDNADTTQFSCLDEKVHGPCTPEILVPPSELMTRSRSFRQAYWKHHAKPTIREVEKLDIKSIDERKERLNHKRREILERIRTKEAHKRQQDMRRRAERVLSGRMHDEDSNDESDEDSEMDESFSMLSLSPESSRKSMRPSLAMMPKGQGRRTLLLSKDSSQEESSNSEHEESAFSFLSEWGKEGT